MKLSFYFQHAGFSVRVVAVYAMGDEEDVDAVSILAGLVSGEKQSSMLRA